MADAASLSSQIQLQLARLRAGDEAARGRAADDRLPAAEPAGPQDAPQLPQRDAGGSRPTTSCRTPRCGSAGRSTRSGPRRCTASSTWPRCRSAAS